MGKYSIGIDYGTLSGRALLVDINTGEEVAVAIKEYPHAVELIDYIEVFKKEKVENEYLQRIDIHFNFVGEINSDNFQALKDYVLQSEEDNQTKIAQVV